MNSKFITACYTFKGSILTILSSCNIIEVSLIEDNSQDSQIFFITYLNHTHSQLAS